MANIIFPEPDIHQEKLRRGENLPSFPITHLIMKYSRGYVRNEEQAARLVLIVVALSFIVSLFLVFNFTLDKKPQLPLQEILKETPRSGLRH